MQPSVGVTWKLLTPTPANWPSTLIAGGTFEIEGQEARERNLLGNVGRPGIGSGDRHVEVAMRVIEPGGPLVVEIGQSALFQDRGALRVFRQDAVGKAGTFPLIPKTQGFRRFFDCPS